MLIHLKEALGRSGTPQTQSGNRMGILLMSVVALLFSIIDAKARFLSQSVDPFIIAWFRQSGLLLAMALAIFVFGSSSLKTNYLGFQVLRGILTAASAVLYIYALKFVPLVEVVAVTFIAPLFMCLLAMIILGERMNPFRWAVVVLGFFGAIIIIRPGLGVFHPAIFLVLLEAVLFALRQIITRKISDKDTPACTIVYTALIGWLLLCLPLPWVWGGPLSGIEVSLLVSTSLLAGLAEVLTIFALSRALAVVVAPIHYTMLVWATALSWVFFSYFPDNWTLLGATIIIGSGLLLLRKEANQT